MTERPVPAPPAGERPGPARSPQRKPSAAGVFWSAAALFAVLFTLFTFQMAGGQAAGGGGGAGSRPVALRKVIQRRIVTTVVPSPGVDRVSRGPATTSGGEIAAEPVTTSTS